MEVIDIPSSPELLPTAPRPTHTQNHQPGPGSQKRKLPLPLAPNRWTEEIIEITDSDSEPEDTLASSENRRLAETQAVPGPSKLPAIGAPRHGGLLAGAALPAAGSSQQNFRNDAVASAPLFYPDDEETELHQEPMVTPQVDIHPAPAPVLPPVPLPQPSQPPEPPAEAQPTTDACVARVLEIVPDVEPAHVLGLTEHFTHNPVNAGQNVLELVLHTLFENPNYPKVDRKGKRKITEDDEEGAVRGQPVPKIDYGATNREFTGGVDYFELALEQLMVDFPYAPKPYLRTQLLKHRFYAPVHLFLAEKRDPPPYVPKSVPSRVNGKGREKHDPKFEAERRWLLQRLEAPASAQAQPAPDQTTDSDAHEECEDGIECGCCFSSYAFDQMVQCPEAHLFCKNCMSSYASNLLGEHNPNIVCMDQSGCKLLFPQSELERFLAPKLLELHHRVRQHKDIEAAGLENLEECPFCDYKCVIENEMEKLFRCENVDCGAVSCRECKKPDHLPKSCKEVESDKQLDVQHIVEEAMTRALMRNCPKCQKAFIKEYGCNKMTCPNCQTVSCYICREVITGYEHFGRINPGIPYNARVDKNKCQLWDPVEQLHATEVQEAAKKAIEELKRDRPDVDESAIKIDLPVAGPARPVPNVGIRPQLLNMRPPLPHLHPPLPVNAAWGLPALPALPNARGPVPGAHAPAPNAYAVPAYGMTKSSPESAVVERPSLAHLEKKASMDMPDLGYQMPVPSNTVFPDTIYGQANTEMRFESETANNILWARYANSQLSEDTPASLSAALSRIKFSEYSSPLPLHSAIQLASAHRPVLVVVGRSRRLAVEDHTAELRQIFEERGSVWGRMSSGKLSGILPLRLLPRGVRLLLWFHNSRRSAARAWAKTGLL